MSFIDSYESFRLELKGTVCSLNSVSVSCLTLHFLSAKYKKGQTCVWPNKAVHCAMFNRES